MDPVTLLAGALALAAGRLIPLLLERFPKIRSFLGDRSDEVPESTSTQTLTSRANSVIERLRESAVEADQLVAEMDSIAAARALAVAQVEARLQEMAREEKETSERLEALKDMDDKTKAAIASVFNQSLMEEGKRGGKRDYILFAAGVITPYILQYGYHFISRLFS
jgi:hypothetical protein